MGQTAELLKSAPGLGKVTTATLLAGLSELGAPDRPQIAHFLGVGHSIAKWSLEGQAHDWRRSRLDSLDTVHERRTRSSQQSIPEDVLQALCEAKRQSKRSPAMLRRQTHWSVPHPSVIKRCQLTSQTISLMRPSRNPMGK
jgi:hypothetical protein